MIAHQASSGTPRAFPQVFSLGERHEEFRMHQALPMFSALPNNRNNVVTVEIVNNLL